MTQKQKKTRGKGKRPAKLHHSVRLDIAMSEGITQMSRVWDCSESDVIRTFILHGLSMTIPQRFKSPTA